MAYISNNGETWNTYFPVNSTVYSPSNIVRLRIPKANYICDLSRAYLSIRTNLPFQPKSTEADSFPAGGKEITAKEYSGSGAFDRSQKQAQDIGFPAIKNAGTIFDIVDMQINGRQLYHDDFNQTSCTLAGFNKSDDWIRSHQATLLNCIDKITPNSQLAYNSLKTSGTATAENGKEYDKDVSQKNIIIPLSLIFPILENVTDWPSFAIDDTLEFNLYVSRLYKYMIDLNWIDKEKHYAVRPVSEAPVFSYSFTDSDSKGYSVDFFPDEFFIDNVVLYMPVHNPSSDEYSQITSLIQQTTGMAWSFRHWKVISYLSRYQSTNETTFTQQVNFNTTVNNMFGISMLALKPGTETVFEKPYINTIQVNLGPWELASNGTHIYDNYTRAGDMLDSLLNNTGQNTLKYYQEINKQVILDHAISLEQASSNTSFFPTGSYITYYDASPHDELGVGANEFANLITYKYSTSQNNGAWIQGNSGLENAKTYCVIQTLSTLSINQAGVICSNPNSRFLSSDTIGDMTRTADPIRMPHGIEHGIGTLVTTAISTLPTIFEGIVGGIKKLHQKVRTRRSNRHMDWFKSKLSEDEFKENYDKLINDSYYIIPSRWKRTYKEIIKNRTTSHGLLIRHGIIDKTYDSGRIGHRDTDIHKTRLRLSPWARFNNYSPRTCLGLKHGMCSTYHGIGSFFSKLLNKLLKRLVSKVPSLLNPTIETGKQIIHALLSGKISKREALEAAKIYFKRTGDDIKEDIMAAVPNHGIMTPKTSLYTVFRDNPNFDVKNFLKDFRGDNQYYKEMKILRENAAYA